MCTLGKKTPIFHSVKNANFTGSYRLLGKIEKWPRLNTRSIIMNQGAKENKKKKISEQSVLRIYAVQIATYQFLKCAME